MRTNTHLDISVGIKEHDGDERQHLADNAVAAPGKMWQHFEDHVVQVQGTLDIFHSIYLSDTKENQKLTIRVTPYISFNLSINIVTVWTRAIYRLI